MGSRVLCGLIAALALALAAPAASATAKYTYPDTFCRQSIQARGAEWGVDGKGPRCRYMRGWTLRWLEGHAHPPGWTCVHLGDGGECDSKRTDHFFEYYKFD